MSTRRRKKRQQDAWGSFFLGGPTVSDDFLPERASQLDEQVRVLTELHESVDELDHFGVPTAYAKARLTKLLEHDPALHAKVLEALSRRKQDL